MWSTYQRYPKPNPLRYTDGIYMYDFLTGCLQEKDLPKLEKFLYDHIFPYRDPVPLPKFIPQGSNCCNCTREFHMEKMASTILTRRINKIFREPIPKFSDYPPPSNNKYCRQTCYGYYAIDDDEILQYYVPREELNLNYPLGRLLCFPYAKIHSISDYLYHRQRPQDV